MSTPLALPSPPRIPQLPAPRIAGLLPAPRSTARVTNVSKRRGSRGRTLPMERNMTVPGGNLLERVESDLASLAGRRDYSIANLRMAAANEALRPLIGTRRLTRSQLVNRVRNMKDSETITTSRGIDISRDAAIQALARLGFI